MQQQAPLDYVRSYYGLSHDKRGRFPLEAKFTYSGLARVDGESVLNVGCGPQFYDHLLQFKTPPRRCVGIDLNAATIEFLRSDLDPRLIESRSSVKAAGTEIELAATDIFDCADELRGRFDWIVGRGFFATFYGGRLPQLLAIMRAALKPDGRLLKTTWHGPHRSPEETAKKLRYGYDTQAAPTPDELVAAFAASGFAFEIDERRACDPATYGWQQLQNCVFRVSR